MREGSVFRERSWVRVEGRQGQARTGGTREGGRGQRLKAARLGAGMSDPSIQM